MTGNFLETLEGDDWPRFGAATVEPHGARLAIVPHAELTWFQGHFPGHPVLAGVVQTHWACLWGRGLLGIDGDFSHIENLKFENIITPDTELTVSLDYAADKGRLLFSYDDAEQRYSSGRIYFQP
ncbi:MAG: hydroxymyristoyl-ACP dehydratase [Pseudomonadota bacterium]